MTTTPTIDPSVLEHLQATRDSAVTAANQLARQCKGRQPTLAELAYLEGHLQDAVEAEERLATLGRLNVGVLNPEEWNRLADLLEQLHDAGMDPFEMSTADRKELIVLASRVVGHQGAVDAHAFLKSIGGQDR